MVAALFDLSGPGQSSSKLAGSNAGQFRESQFAGQLLQAKKIRIAVLHKVVITL